MVTIETKRVVHSVKRKMFRVKFGSPEQHKALWRGLRDQIGIPVKMFRSLSCYGVIHGWDFRTCYGNDGILALIWMCFAEGHWANENDASAGWRRYKIEWSYITPCEDQKIRSRIVDSWNEFCVLIDTPLGRMTRAEWKQRNWRFMEPEGVLC